MAHVRLCYSRSQLLEFRSLPSCKDPPEGFEVSSWRELLGGGVPIPSANHRGNATKPDRGSLAYSKSPQDLEWRKDTWRAGAPPSGPGSWGSSQQSGSSLAGFKHSHGPQSDTSSTRSSPDVHNGLLGPHGGTNSSSTLNSGGGLNHRWENQRVPHSERGFWAPRGPENRKPPGFSSRQIAGDAGGDNSGSNFGGEHPLGSGRAFRSGWTKQDGSESNGGDSSDAEKGGERGGKFGGSGRGWGRGSGGHGDGGVMNAGEKHVGFGRGTGGKWEPGAGRGHFRTPLGPPGDASDRRVVPGFRQNMAKANFVIPHTAEDQRNDETFGGGEGSSLGVDKLAEERRRREEFETWRKQQQEKGERVLGVQKENHIGQGQPSRKHDLDSLWDGSPAPLSLPQDSTKFQENREEEETSAASDVSKLWSTSEPGSGDAVPSVVVAGVRPPPVPPGFAQRQLLPQKVNEKNAKEDVACKEGLEVAESLQDRDEKERVESSMQAKELVEGKALKCALETEVGLQFSGSPPTELSPEGKSNGFVGENNAGREDFIVGLKVSEETGTMDLGNKKAAEVLNRNSLPEVDDQILAQSSRLEVQEDSKVVIEEEKVVWGTSLTGGNGGLWLLPSLVTTSQEKSVMDQGGLNPNTPGGLGEVLHNRQDKITKLPSVADEGWGQGWGVVPKEKDRQENAEGTKASSSVGLWSFSAGGLFAQSPLMPLPLPPKGEEESRNRSPEESGALSSFLDRTDLAGAGSELVKDRLVMPSPALVDGLGHGARVPSVTATSSAGESILQSIFQGNNAQFKTKAADIDTKVTEDAVDKPRSLLDSLFGAPQLGNGGLLFTKRDHTSTLGEVNGEDSPASRMTLSQHDAHGIEAMLLALSERTTTRTTEKPPEEATPLSYQYPSPSFFPFPPAFSGPAPPSHISSNVLPMPSGPSLEDIELAMGQGHSARAPLVEGMILADNKQARSEMGNQQGPHFVERGGVENGTFLLQSLFPSNIPQLHQMPPQRPELHSQVSFRVPFQAPFQVPETQRSSIREMKFICVEELERSMMVDSSNDKNQGEENESRTAASVESVGSSGPANEKSSTEKNAASVHLLSLLGKAMVHAPASTEQAITGPVSSPSFGASLGGGSIVQGEPEQQDSVNVSFKKILDLPMPIHHGVNQMPESYEGNDTYKDQPEKEAPKNDGGDVFGLGGGKEISVEFSSHHEIAANTNMDPAGASTPEESVGESSSSALSPESHSILAPPLASSPLPLPAPTGFVQPFPLQNNFSSQMPGLLQHTGHMPPQSSLSSSILPQHHPTPAFPPPLFPPPSAFLHSFHAPNGQNAFPQSQSQQHGLHLSSLPANSTPPQAPLMTNPLPAHLASQPNSAPLLASKFYDHQLHPPPPMMYSGQPTQPQALNSFHNFHPHIFGGRGQPHTHLQSHVHPHIQQDPSQLQFPPSYPGIMQFPSSHQMISRPPNAYISGPDHRNQALPPFAPHGSEPNTERQSGILSAPGVVVPSITHAGLGTGAHRIALGGPQFVPPPPPLTQWS